MNSVIASKNKIPTGLVFLGGLLLYLLAVLPVCLRNGGLFFYYGDYNVQQVPFLIFAHRAVREGRFFWNPLVDLGGNMGGTFSFYLWGSPFFWLTVPFPEKWLPYMMPGIMALKYGTAAAAAYTWIRTQTKTDRAALVGAFLYAFSGFQACNIVFQHFHDATAFFPLYLLSFDRLVQGGAGVPRNAFGHRVDSISQPESGRGAGNISLLQHKYGEGSIPRSESGRRGVGIPRSEPGGGSILRPESGRGSDRASSYKNLQAVRKFAFMTALMAVINYYFFFGQVLFLVLYYIVRYGARRAKAEGFPAPAKEVLRILVSGAAGLLLSAFFLVQSVGGILGNTRVSKVLDGYDLLVYPDATTPLAILKSFFMVPDLVARGTLFSSDAIRNGSLAFYLPCFAMAGVFAFWRLRKKSWKKTLASVLCVIAFVPFLNAAFSAMNANYYARWFYMPVLLCACMTAEALEEEESEAFTKGAVLSLAVTAAFILLCWLPVKEGGKWSFTAICENRKLLMAEVRTTLLGMAALLAVVFLKRRRPGLFSSAGEDLKSAAPSLRNCNLFSNVGGKQKSEAPSPRDRMLFYGTGGNKPPEEESSPEKGSTDQAQGILNREDKKTPWLCAACIALVLFCCVSTTRTVVKNGSSLISHRGFEKWKRQMLTERPILGYSEEEQHSLEQELEPQEASLNEQKHVSLTAASDSVTGFSHGVDAPFSRVETDGTSTNYEMVWGYPTMHCFESTIHPSIIAWYRGIGMIRTVESTLPLERIGARAVMSVRYYIENTLVVPDNSYSDQGGMDGYTPLNEENGYNVYETENYIPMGFSFGSYMTEENYDLLKNGPISDRVLVKDLILSAEMAEKYGSLMDEDTDTAPGEMPYGEFYAHCQDRKESACTEFSFDKNGWHALAHMEKDNLLLFSIPYDEGFSVTIDGKPAQLERADFGLSAVFVPQGAHEIRALYMPVGFYPALFLSLAAAAALALTAACDAFKRRQQGGSGAALRFWL